MGLVFAAAATAVSHNYGITALIAIAGIAFSMLTHETRQGGAITPVPVVCWSVLVFGGVLSAVLTAFGAILAGLMFHWRDRSIRNLFFSYIPAAGMLIFSGKLFSISEVSGILLIPAGILIQFISRGLLDGWTQGKLLVTSVNWAVNGIAAYTVFFFISENGLTGGAVVVSVMAVFMSHAARTGNRLAFFSGRIGALSLQNRIISCLYREDIPYALYFLDSNGSWTIQGKPASSSLLPSPEAVKSGIAPGWSIFPMGGAAFIATGAAADDINSLPTKQLSETLSLLESIWKASFSKRRLENAFLGVAGMLVRIADKKDSDTHRHSIRVSQTAVKLGKILGLSDEELFQLRIGAMLHDIGKLTIPGSLIMKKGLLTEDERKTIEAHPKNGAKLLEPMERYSSASRIVRQHHERIDGSGYPEGLKGSEISLHARIVAVADTFDAITSPRAYHLGKPAHIALREILRYRGTGLDAVVVDALRTMLR